MICVRKDRIKTIIWGELERLTLTTTAYHCRFQFVLIGILVLLQGCATQIIRNPVPQKLIADAEIIGLTDVRSWGDEIPDDLEQRVHITQQQLLRRIKGSLQKKYRAINMLALSGGGENGAFGAGLLVGWSERGTRPKFDFVTGVSTGALMAPFAFLGSHHDDKLRDIYTKYGLNDLVDKQPLAGLLGGQSIADNTKLKNLVAKYVDKKLLAEIAVEYRKGRRLKIGTTNLDAQRPVIWHMGKIAASNRPGSLELFRNILIASSALPGIFPPVYITVKAGGQKHEEMHVDGGPTVQVFFAPTQVIFGNIDKNLGTRTKRTLYVIRNGRLNPEWQVVKANTFKIAERSLATIIKNQGIGDLDRIYNRSRRDGIRFRMASIPESFTSHPNSPFDKRYMNELFEFARKLAQNDNLWVTAPPDFLQPTR